MRKYIGTSTISKKTKNTNRSRLRKLPITPASSSSSQARYGFSSWWASAPMMASGKRIPVSTTSSSEMPSTPRCQEIPHSSIHSWRDTNWKPASALSNPASSQMLRAPVSTLLTRPTSFTSSGRRRLTSATATAPATGTSTSAVRIGKPRDLHYMIPRAMTNQASSPTTPMPMIAA